jgi:hypothetical protein
MTNEQVGERLGISPDGAKYHVSQILSKLGVATREEAAAWGPDSRAAPVFGIFGLLARAAGAAVVAGAVVGLGVLAWGVASETSSLTLTLDGGAEPEPFTTPRATSDLGLPLCDTPGAPSEATPAGPYTGGPACDARHFGEPMPEITKNPPPLSTPAPAP